MKLFLAAFLLLPFTASAGQEENNFIVIGGTITWKKKYENHSSAGILELFRESGLIHDTQTTADKITGHLKHFEPDFSSSGFTEGTIAGFLKGVTLSGLLTVEINAHSYYVTISNIKIHRNSDKSVSPLEKHAIKEGRLDRSFAKGPAILVNLCLEKRLSIVTAEDKF